MNRRFAALLAIPVLSIAIGTGFIYASAQTEPDAQGSALVLSPRVRANPRPAPRSWPKLVPDSK